jgi:hypothetical protein
MAEAAKSRETTFLRYSTPQNPNVCVFCDGLRCPFEGNCVSGFLM